MKSFSALSAAGRGMACLPGRRLYAPVAAARPRDRHTRASLGVVDLEARPGPATAPGASRWPASVRVSGDFSPAFLPSRGRRPAREIATREPSARSDRSRSPARPCRRPRAPQPGLAHQSLRCPPHRRRLRRCVWWRVVSKPGISTITCRSVKCARGNVCEYVLSRPCRRLSNFARNSRLAVSNVELVSLELQRFREVSKNDRDKLRAKFVWR